MKNLQETVFAIVGLGLIGGSYAKALRGQKVQKILGLDTNPIVTLMAKDEGYITDNIDECPERLKEADVIVCAMYPGAFVPFVKEHVKDFKPDVLLTDVMGIKGDLPDQVDALLGPDMDFVPTHPMAGREGLQPKHLPDFPGVQLHHHQTGQQPARARQMADGHGL